MFSILHLEQNDFFREIVKNILSENGFIYYSTYTAKEAYEMLETHKIDLIITSCLIEDEDIEEFVKTLNRGKFKNMPIFVITSNELEENKKRLLNLGVSDYITKDNIMEELLEHIEATLKENELYNLLKKSRVAVIDDSSFDIEVTRNILRDNGVNNVDTYLSGDELFQSGKKYDLYIIDIVLKNEFGKEIVKKIRKTNSNAAITVVSSLTNPKTISSILYAGADDYIRKPVRDDIFIAKLAANMRNIIIVRNMEDKMVDLLSKLDQIK